MLEKNSPKPLYQQLKDILVDAIDSEKWKANEKIPSENELSSIYGLTVTIFSATNVPFPCTL